MKNKKTLTLVISLLSIQIFSLKAWLMCRNFVDSYHFSLYDLVLQINDGARHNEGVPVFLVRVFHNKVLQFVIDVYRRYTHFFDWQLLITLISFVGLFGVLLGIWYFVDSKKKNKFVGFLILAMFLTPFIEMLFNPRIDFDLKLFLIAVPFQTVSSIGHYQFMNKHKSLLTLFIYIALIILSIAWIAIIPGQAFRYCAKI